MSLDCWCRTGGVADCPAADFDLDSRSGMLCNSLSVGRAMPGRFWNGKMWRLLLVSYLLLAACMGNSSCCCAAARWSGWLSTWGESSTIQEDRPTIPQSACCARRAGQRLRPARPSDGTNISPEPMSGPRPPCDCQSGGCQPELSRPAALASGDGENDLLDGAGRGGSHLPPQFPWSGWRTDQTLCAWKSPPPLRVGRLGRISLCSWRC